MFSKIWKQKKAARKNAALTLKKTYLYKRNFTNYSGGIQQCMVLCPFLFDKWSWAHKIHRDEQGQGQALLYKKI